MLFGHGDDYYQTNREIRINYSSNVWYGTDLTPVKEFIYRSFEQVTHYPEPDAASLKHVLADIHAISEENFLITNGSITAFYLIAEAWQRAKSVLFFPSFAEYEDACQRHHHQLLFFSNRKSLTELDLNGADLCWICNPNNPDGHLIERDVLLKCLRKYPQTTFIIDQVYSDFCEEEPLYLKEVETYPNLILVQSISKLHKIPGIRIGYIATSKEIIGRLKRHLIPWSVNVLAIEIGKYVLTHTAQFPFPLKRWLDDTHKLQEEIRQTGIEVYPSNVTFFLCRLQKGKKAAELKDYLLKEQGILIRDASNFRGLDERYFRLSTQKPEENRIFLEYLKKSEYTHLVNP